MIPLILHCANKKEGASFIASLREKHSIPESHLYHIEPLKKEISIQQIREMKRASSLSSKGIRLYVIWDIDTAGIEAQNALLKILEEHAPTNQYLLVSQNPAGLIPTILSRSKTIELRKKSTEKENNAVSSDTVSLLEEAMGNGTYSFLAHPKALNMNKEKSQAFLDEVIWYYRRSLSEPSHQSVAVIKRALGLRRLLAANNLNPQLAIDTLLIFIHKLYKLNQRT